MSRFCIPPLQVVNSHPKKVCYINFAMPNTISYPKKISDTESKDIELEEKLQQLGAQELEEKAKALAQSLKLPYLDLRLLPIDPSALALVPESQARKANFVILSRSGRNLQAAANDPANPLVEQLKTALEKQGYNLRLFVTSPTGINRALNQYSQIKTGEKTTLGVVQISEEQIQKLQQELTTLEELRKRVGTVTITQLVELLLAGALKLEASDIHLEPEESVTRLRYRVDGVLQDITDILPDIYGPLLNRIKIVSGMKLNIHQKPQDGRFTIRLEQIDIEIRVSVLPGGYGESIVMRLLDPRTIRQKIADLGMRPDLLEVIKNELQKTTGAILTTGPTGSGKTTTLYAFLRQVNNPGVKIITIEDPIEYHVPDIVQTQVRPKEGYTFANGLRSIVRQDPDAILVGEIRDIETAEIAMHAALTGHLVFSTLHTNDAAGTIPRLIDLGVKPQIIAPAINIAMAQRLLRRLCEACKKGQPLGQRAKEFQMILGGIKNPQLSIKEITPQTIYYTAQKCAACNETGYRSRIAVFEAFVVDEDIERLILASPSIADVRKMAIEKGMVTLLQDGYLKVLQGICDIAEVQRVIGAGNN